MTNQTFGPGDYGSYDDWAKSGSNTFYTNWNTTTWDTSVLGRIIKVAARWDRPTSVCGTTTGHNSFWGTGRSLGDTTTTFTATGRADGTTEAMHDVALNGDWWQNSASYFLGFSRTATHCSIFAWNDGAQGGYAGKSAVDTNNSGGTTNWGGTVNGGLPVFGTVTISNIFVRRSGVWNRVYVQPRRSGNWGVPASVYVRVRRSGVWGIVNWMQQGYHVPPEGMAVEINLGEYWEPGWMVEEGETSWFGNEDPTGRGIDWTKPGHHEWPFKPWTGRYSSQDSDEVAEERLRARYEWDKALRDERYRDARIWNTQFQPPLTKEKPPLESEELATSMACGC